MAMTLLAIRPIVHITTDNPSDSTSRPATQRLNAIHANRIIFSRSPPKIRIGLVKLCKSGVIVLDLGIGHIWTENMVALTNNEAAKNTIPPTAMILIS